MREMKWTPGEWHQAHREKSDGMWSTEVFDQCGETIATLAWHPVRTSWGLTTDRSANAHLIAAAPEMYEALRDMVTSYEALGSPLPMAREVEIALDALAKARGEQP